METIKLLKAERKAVQREILDLEKKTVVDIQRIKFLKGVRKGLDKAITIVMEESKHENQA